MSDDLLKLAALADRVEATTGSNRDLDADIAGALGETIIHEPGDEWFILCKGGLGRRAVPAYTASIDDAMTLVPEGWGGKLLFSENRPDRELHCSATLARSYPTNADSYSEKSGKNGDRASMPLALCAAALRARSAA